MIVLYLLAVPFTIIAVGLFYLILGFVGIAINIGILLKGNKHEKD